MVTHSWFCNNNASTVGMRTESNESASMQRENVAIHFDSWSRVRSPPSVYQTLEWPHVVWNSIQRIQNWSFVCSEIPKQNRKLFKLTLGIISWSHRVRFLVSDELPEPLGGFFQWLHDAAPGKGGPWHQRIHSPHGLWMAYAGGHQLAELAWMGKVCGTTPMNLGWKGW